MCSSMLASGEGWDPVNDSSLAYNPKLDSTVVVSAKGSKSDSTFEVSAEGSLRRPCTSGKLSDEETALSSLEEYNFSLGAFAELVRNSSDAFVDLCKDMKEPSPLVRPVTVRFKPTRAEVL